MCNTVIKTNNARKNIKNSTGIVAYINTQYRRWFVMRVVWLSLQMVRRGLSVVQLGL